MRAFYFALVASAATAFSHSYTQSYVQTDSELDDDVQFDQPIEMPEVEIENAAHAGVAASVRKHSVQKSQVDAQKHSVQKSQVDAQPQAEAGV